MMCHNHHASKAISSADDDKKHTEQYNYVNGIPFRDLEWCEDFDGDLDKIAKKLTGDTFNREFLMHVAIVLSCICASRR